MRTAVAFGLALALAAGTASPTQVDEAARDRRLGIALKGISKSGLRLDTVRIEVIDGETRDPSELVVYGSGVGVWDGRSQFEFEPELVRRAVKRLHEAGFAGLGERVVGPSPTPTATPGPAPEATQVMSAISVTIGELEKTVYQDNKAYRSAEFAKLRDDLIAIFRGAASIKKVTPKDLDDALTMLSTGVLHPELLELTVNAPQQRELKSQDGQGWMLRVRNGLVEARLHDLKAGYAPAVQKQLGPEEAQRIATWLREAQVTDLPQNLPREGYTDLTVGVLRLSKSMQARKFSGRDPAEQATQRAAFDVLRSHLESKCREMLTR